MAVLRSITVGARSGRTGLGLTAAGTLSATTAQMASIFADMAWTVVGVSTTLATGRRRSPRLLTPL